MTWKLIKDLAVSREGDVFLITVPHYWGKGATMTEARKKLREVCGKPFDEHKQWRLYSVDPTTYLDEMGYINHPENHPPVMLAECDPL